MPSTPKPTATEATATASGASTPGGSEASAGDNAATASSSASTPVFKDNEKVFCYHGPLLYEAKCIKSRKDPKDSKGALQFFVHYQGWNKNWDEWVPETRILKINPENIEKKEKLLSSHRTNVKENKSKKGPKSEAGPLTLGGNGGSIESNESKSKTQKQNSKDSGDGGGGGSGGGSNPGSKPASARASPAPPPPTTTSTSGSSSRKRRRSEQNDDSNQSADGTKSSRFQLEIPEELKFVLVSDWDLVYQRKQLFSLPAKISAASILNEFSKSCTKKHVDEVISGIKDVFNQTIRTQLLYKLETIQYQDEVKDQILKQKDEQEQQKALVDVYGSPHLLRLMVKLSDILSKMTGVFRTEEDSTKVKEILVEFLDFLEANRAKYFTSRNYVEASEKMTEKLAQKSKESSAVNE